MAQLKDLLVSGQSRLVNDVYIQKLQAPTTAGGSTFGLGTDGQILKSNGSSTYWGDFPVVDVSHGGTGVAWTNTNKIAPAANTVFAGDSNSSHDANNSNLDAPSFRKLVADDLPTVPVIKGGTGVSAAAANTVFAGPAEAGSSAAEPSFRQLNFQELGSSQIRDGLILSYVYGGKVSFEIRNHLPIVSDAYIVLKPHNSLSNDIPCIKDDTFILDNGSFNQLMKDYGIDTTSELEVREFLHGFDYILELRTDDSILYNSSPTSLASTLGVTSYISLQGQDIIAYNGTYIDSGIIANYRQKIECSYLTIGNNITSISKTDYTFWLDLRPIVVKTSDLQDYTLGIKCCSNIMVQPKLNNSYTITTRSASSSYPHPSQWRINRYYIIFRGSDLV